ncbi:MAG: hypothetical protein ABJ004_02320 [Cyclobacteriaceae bacterium]
MNSKKNNLPSIVQVLIIFIFTCSCEQRSKSATTTEHLKEAVLSEKIQTIKELGFYEIAEAKNRPYVVTQSPYNKFTANFLFVKDSQLFEYNISTQKTRSLYNPSGSFNIIKFERNWNSGIFILEGNPRQTRLINIPNSTDSIKIINQAIATDGEGTSTITNFSISPSGDFAILNMSFSEIYGIRFVNLENGTVRETISTFVKWLPNNSALIVNDRANFLEGPSPVEVTNLNLETGDYISWTISENTHYEGFEENRNGVTIICLPTGEPKKNLKFLRLDHNDLKEVPDTTEHNSLRFITGDNLYTAQLDLSAQSKFTCLVSDSANTIFQKTYELKYSCFDNFKFRELSYLPKKQEIVITFDVQFNWKNYGSVDYVIDLNGVLKQKQYTNVSQEHYKLDFVHVEHLIDSTSNIANYYRNGTYEKTMNRNPLPLEVPSKIIYN